jgi:hypothetical protein
MRLAQEADQEAADADLTTGVKEDADRPWQ